MRLRIHHAAAEVGGNCIELECDGQRLLLDLGLPLESAPRMPLTPGLTTPDPSMLGVVLSHPHLDHYGLLLQCRPDLPVWLGEGATRLLASAAPFAAGSMLAQAPSTYRDRQPFEVGPFRITPYLMDHSAFDAHALLVKAGGKRVFYTGDFRGHGRKAAVFELFLAAPPADVDVLLMEGTSIGREEASPSESDVETRAAELMRASSGLILLCFSGQNIDRFVTFLRASMKAGRTLVVDAYMAALLAGLSMKGLPDVREHPGARVFLPRSQKRMIVRDGRFDLIEPYRSKRIFAEELLDDPARFSVMFRASMAADFKDADLAGGGLIYSLWPGYLERDRTDLRGWATRRGLEFHLLHSSGHASRAGLQRMAKAVDAKRLIPIHTAEPAAFTELFERVEVASNGPWMNA